MKNIIFLLSISFLIVSNAYGETTTCENFEICDWEKPTYFQISFFEPWQTSSRNREVQGVRLNFIYGNNIRVKGLDLGLFNFTQESVTGLQVGLLNNVGGNFKGLQVGAANIV